MVMRIGVVGNINNDGLTKATTAALAKAYVLAKAVNIQHKNTQLDLILLGENKIVNAKIKALPCNTVYAYHGICKDDVVNREKAITHYYQSAQPNLIVIAQDALTDTVVPLVATKLNVSGFLECDSLAYDTSMEKIMIRRAVYSGNATAHYVVDGCAVVAIRLGKKAEQELPDSKPKIIDVQLNGEGNKSPLITKEYEPIVPSGLNGADLVIICGYGVGNKKEVERIAAYAKKIGAAVGGTKKIVDMGWLPIHQLVGQTGQTIAPKMCITVGVSGAMPLVNGMLGAEQIIAINTDPSAQIFSYADIGIVDDYRVIFDEIEKTGFSDKQTER